MARKASSGFSKFERVNNAMVTSPVTRRTRQRRIDRVACRTAEARGDIAIRPKQIGRSGFRRVTRRRKAGGVGVFLRTDPDHADLARWIDRRAVCEFDQRKATTAVPERIGEI